MREKTLSKILAALVEDFGYQQVRKSLTNFSRRKAKGSIPKQSSSDGNSKSRVRQSAISIVKSLVIEEEEKRDLLQTLAKKFDEKTFMPNVNAVRAFLSYQGKDVSHIKSRQQAVSIVFKSLANCTTNELFQMHVKGLYAGPKSLAVIAESIEGIGQRNRL